MFHKMASDGKQPKSVSFPKNHSQISVDVTTAVVGATSSRGFPVDSDVDVVVPVSPDERRFLLEVVPQRVDELGHCHGVGVVRDQTQDEHSVLAEIAVHELTHGHLLNSAPSAQLSQLRQLERKGKGAAVPLSVGGGSWVPI